MTVACCWANAKAVALPSPEVLPVTRQIFPCISVGVISFLQSSISIVLFRQNRDFQADDCGLSLLLYVACTSCTYSTRYCQVTLIPCSIPRSTATFSAAALLNWTRAVTLVFPASSVKSTVVR